MAKRARWLWTARAMHQAGGRQAHPAATQPFGDPLDNRAHFIRQPRGSSRPSSGSGQAQSSRSTTRVASTPWLIICKSAKSGLMDEPRAAAKGGECAECGSPETGCGASQASSSCVVAMWPDPADPPIPHCAACPAQPAPVISLIALFMKHFH